MCWVCGLLSGWSKALPLEMRALMDSLDSPRCRVLAVWTPRHLNAVPDALASLCGRLNLPTLSGRLADVAAIGARLEVGGAAP